jgi:hypothetical protein
VDGAAQSFRVVWATAAIVLASLLLAICATTAHAAPLSMTFTEGRANVGDQLVTSDLEDALFRAPDTAPFTAQIDTGTGSITAGVMDVPDFDTFITTPVNADVNVKFDIGEISGSFNQATGALTLIGTAGGTLTSDGKSCTVSTTPAVLTLTTAGTTGGTSSLSGIPFTNGLSGAGAIAGQWTDMHAEPVTEDDESFCNNVEDHIGGPGGVWLEHEGDIVPPARVAAGGGYTCVIKTNGTPICWGNTGPLPGGIGTVEQVAAGYSHACAIKTDGTPICWGWGANEDGQSTVPSGIGTVKQIAAGGYHTCAIKTDRTPVCWGANDEGQSTVPADIGTVRQISAAVYHTCAVKTDGTPVCWGDNSVGQITLPVDIGTVSRIAAGGEGHTCAIKTNGTPVCWGANDIGQTTVPSGIGTVKQIVAGDSHTCAIKTDDTPICWGRNAPNGPQPSLPTGIGTVKQITAGEFHSCAIKADDTPVCWGGHVYGQLGGTLTIASGSLPSLIGAGPFLRTYTLAPRFDSLPVRFFLSSGELPPGLSLNETTGVLSGTPTEEGTFTGAVSATNDIFSPDATQPFSITVDTTAPAAPSGLAPIPASPSSNLQPRIVGTAGVGTVRLYDNATCTGSPRATGGAGTFASPGLQVTVAAGSTTTFYATARDAAGNTSACSTSKATYVNVKDPAPGPGTPGGPGTPNGKPKPRACVVPKLVGKTLAKAKKALKAAHCKLGEVHKPKQPNGKKRRVLVVKSSSPRRGAKPTDRTVDLKLHPKPKPKKTRR